MGWADGNVCVGYLIEVGDVALIYTDCGPERFTVRGLHRGGRVSFWMRGKVSKWVCVGKFLSQTVALAFFLVLIIKPVRTLYDPLPKWHKYANKRLAREY